MMQAPTQLLFVRSLDCIVPTSIKKCVEQLHFFRPSLSAQFHIKVTSEGFVMQYGDDAQMKLWVVGTLQEIDNSSTQVQAKIGIDRQHSNLKYVAGLSGLVMTMAFAEALDDGFDWGGVLLAGGLFVAGFWILLILGMGYSQHRLRRDLIKFLSQL